MQLLILYCEEYKSKPLIYIFFRFCLYLTKVVGASPSLVVKVAPNESFKELKIQSIVRIAILPLARSLSLYI